MNIKIVIKKKINGFIKYLYRLFYKLIPIQKKTFLFVAYHGRGYLCNPKAIHEYMSQCEAYHDYQFIWALKKDHYVDIPNAKVIRYNSLQFFYYLARSKYWIFNCKMPAYLMKKKDQIYLQTWHGTPLKKLAHDINIGPSATFYRSQVTKDQMTKSYDIDRQRYDYFLSPSAFATEKFISSFQLNLNQILEVGYPRNDFLTNITEEKIRQLKQKYNLPQDKKIILYAPTWRDNSYNSKGYTYE
ncbi:MAG: CDP-glycerol glycerophosphotransferase family protein, partial [Turicibacter sp.]